MSIKEQNVQFNDLEILRWEQFKHFKDAGLTDFDIALKWHLKSIKQVQRLKTKAKRNGSYKEWMDDKLAWIGEEFPELHAIIKKKYPKLAYLVIAKLYAKAIPQRVEMETKEENYTKIDLNGFNDADKAKLDAAARLLECTGQRESSGLH